MGTSLGTSLEGCYNCVPPPGTTGFGKKFRRGLRKVGKRAVKTTIKIHTAPIKVVAKAGKFAVRAMAKLAAKPIIAIVNKLAGRRAKYLAFQKTGKTTTTVADRRAGGQYALGKLKKAGPVGQLAVKIIKFTGGVTSGDGGDVLGGVITRDVSGWRRDAAICGIAPAAIAAAIPPILMAVKTVMSSLNKPGEAPANPETPTTVEDASTSTQPVVESAEETTPEGAEEVTPEEEDADRAENKG